MENFKNGDLSYSCGQAKTEVFKYDDVMPRLKARSSAHTIRKRYVWAQIFLNTENFENTRYVWIVKRDQKRYVWTQIFLNAEEKISVFENTRLRVDEALDIAWFIH